MVQFFLPQVTSYTGTLGGTLGILFDNWAINIMVFLIWHELNVFSLSLMDYLLVYSCYHGMILVKKIWQ